MLITAFLWKAEFLFKKNLNNGITVEDAIAK